MPDEYDGPWKEALEVYLQPLLEFCFPTCAAAINWDVPPQFLDQELQETVLDAGLGPQRVDKLIRVQLRDGTQEWILVHVEVQHQHDRDLAERVYQYHFRVRYRFGRRVVSLVILADEQSTWRPSAFEEELFGCGVRFNYPICKLLDLVEQARRDSERGYPAAVLVLANWATQQTRHNPLERRRWKWELTRRLYDAGLGKKDILQLYRLLDWLLRLPEEQEQAYKEELRQLEQSRSMPYITSIERMGREEGREEGRQEGREEGRQKGREEGREEGRIQMAREALLEVINARFGGPSLLLQERVKSTTDPDRLQACHRLALRCANIAEVETLLAG